MLKILEVSSRSSWVIQGQIRIVCCMEVKLGGWGISSDAEQFGGQFKVIKGHPRSNGLPMLYGLETWWMESSPDAKHIEGQFKVIRGHPRSNLYSFMYGSE